MGGREGEERDPRGLVVASGAREGGQVSVASRCQPGPWLTCRRAGRGPGARGFTPIVAWIGWLCSASVGTECLLSHARAARQQPSCSPGRGCESLTS